MLSRRAVLVSALAIIPARAAAAHSYKTGDIAIGHVWALPSVNGETQVFFPLSNRGKTADHLVAARSDVCSGIEFRENYRYDAPAIDKIAIEPGKPLAMRPKARHLRLLGCRKPLALGDRFPLVIDFLNSGEVEVEVIVETGGGH